MRRRESIVPLSAGHACVDFYQGAVTALVPFFVAERSYTYAAASGIVLAASLLSSLAQPLFGALTDRRALPWLLPVSTLLAGAGTAFAGVIASYATTLTLVAIAGIGVAAYHPESARLARRASRGSHTAMGWFSLGGNLGFACAPLLVALVMAGGGLGLTPVLIVPALVGAALCAPALRGADTGSAARTGARTGGADLRSFAVLTLTLICRSVVFIGLGTFISLYAQERTGGGASAGAIALFLLYLGGAAGTVVGGRLADRWDRVTVVRWSCLLTLPAVAGVVLVPGPALYLFVLLTSAGLYIPFSLQVTLGQDYLPNHVGTASGITLGLTISVGGLASPLIGALADATSLRTALAPLIVLPALAWLLVRLLAEPPAPPLAEPAPRPPLSGVGSTGG
ncbi:MFS transporter [Micromonospora citrea]|uniref:MFS transporter n=1 Tax=Micromonospora citrea TaxID=47855 RepID=UPI000B8275DA|nr:MFS transporter [Micromonospora citrea]